MRDDAPSPPFPEHPELRNFAQVMEDAGLSGDILDARWRTVFISSEASRMAI